MLLQDSNTDQLHVFGRQISKFTKYGHEVYLLIFLKLINKKSQNIPKNVFPTNYKHLFDLSVNVNEECHWAK